MNANRYLETPALLTAILPSPAVGNATKAAPEPVRVFIVDDQTGEELSRKHGSQPLQVDDLIVLVNAVLLGTTPVQLVHQAVDEDATDNGIAQMVFKPFSGGRRPTAPKSNMPLRQFAAMARQFQSDRAIWQHKIAAYRKDVKLAAQAFVQSFGETQLEVAQQIPSSEVGALSVKLQTLVATNDRAGIATVAKGLVADRQDRLQVQLVPLIADACRAIGFTREGIAAAGGSVAAQRTRTRQRLNFEVAKAKDGGIQLHLGAEGFEGGACVEALDALQAELRNRGVHCDLQERRRKPRRPVVDRARIGQRVHVRCAN